jgi:uncharacterized protein (TIGR03435 family)
VRSHTRTIVAGFLLVAAASLAGASSLRAQAAPGVTFDVASVKVNTSGATNGSLRPGPGGRVDAVNMPLRMLITFAYQLRAFQLVGDPGWVATTRYDIVAKLPVASVDAAPASGSNLLTDMQSALRALLADRFKLATHQETRTLDVYSLVLARPNAPRPPGLTPSTEDCASVTQSIARGGAPPPPPPGSAIVCGMRQSGGHIEAGGTAMSQVASILSNQAAVGRVVVDKTGLAGAWDFELTFAPAAAANASPSTDAASSDAPSLFTALQEQLGLKLEPGKGPVEVTIVDHIETPTSD